MAATCKLRIPLGVVKALRHMPVARRALHDPMLPYDHVREGHLHLEARVDLLEHRPPNLKLLDGCAALVACSLERVACIALAKSVHRRLIQGGAM